MSGKIRFIYSTIVLLWLGHGTTSWITLRLFKRVLLWARLISVIKTTACYSWMNTQHIKETIDTSSFLNPIHFVTLIHTFSQKRSSILSHIMDAWPGWFRSNVRQTRIASGQFLQIKFHLLQSLPTCRPSALNFSQWLTDAVRTRPPTEDIGEYETQRNEHRRQAPVGSTGTH